MTIAAADIADTVPTEPSLRYASVGQRFGAHLLDLLILMPYMWGIAWLAGKFRLFELYFFIPSLAFGLWFSVYLVKRYGGTPGKVLMKIRIAKTDGSAVGYREAFLRYVVLAVLSALLSAAQITVLLHMGDAEYLSLSFMERAQRINELLPPWSTAVTWAMQIWIWGEFLVMLTNKQRRAPHDFMAGTVVIKRNQE